MANIELLKRLRIRFLRMRHKKHFNMKPVAAKTDCGAVMCIAGHTLVLAGYGIRLNPYRDKGNTLYEGRTDFNFISPDGKIVVDILNTAAKELGIPYEEGEGNKAFDLFHDFQLKTPKQAARRIEQLIAEYDQ